MNELGQGRTHTHTLQTNTHRGRKWGYKDSLLSIIQLDTRKRCGEKRSKLSTIFFSVDVVRRNRAETGMRPRRTRSSSTGESAPRQSERWD